MAKVWNSKLRRYVETDPQADEPAPSPASGDLERARRIVSQGASIMLPGDDVAVTFTRGNLTRLIAEALAERPAG